MASRRRPKLLRMLRVEKIILVRVIGSLTKISKEEVFVLFNHQNDYKFCNSQNASVFDLNLAF